MSLSRSERGRWSHLAVLLATSTVASVLALAPAADAATWTVKCDEDKLIAAINNANANPGHDTINLKKGCEYEFEWADNDQNALPVITDSLGTPALDLTINGNGAKLVRDGDAQTFRLLQIGLPFTEQDGLRPAQVLIKDLTVRGGYVTNPSGGGIAVESGSSLTATNLKVLDNEVVSIGGEESFAAGGGISCDDCAVLALNKSTVADNEVTAIGFAPAIGVAGAGGIAADGTNEADITLLRTAVKGNDVHARGATCDGPGCASSVAFAGGISVSLAGTFTLTDSSVTKNIADSRSSTVALSNGGGINVGGGTGSAAILVTIADSVVSGNTAIAEDAIAQGGGLFLLLATTTIAESEITKNTAHAAGGGSRSLGGGVFQDGGTLIVDGGEDADEDEASEISHNKASATGFASAAQGGGFFLGDAISETDGQAVFNFTEFEENEVRSPDGTARGGGLYVGDTAMEPEVTLNQAEVTENEADGLVAQGGGIYVECDATVDYDLSEIDDNDPDDIFEETGCTPEE